MWSDVSRFTLFQSDGYIGVRREVDEVMHPSCLVPTVQACRGSVMIWGSETLCAQKMRLADYLNILNDQVFPLMDGTDIYQDDNAMINRVQIVKA